MGTLEIISLIAGFVFQFIANQQKAQADALLATIKRDQAYSEIADKAAARGGIWLRRFIVGSLLLSFVYFPFLSAWASLPVVVEVKSTIGGYLFGLIPERVIVDFVPIQGFLMQDDTKEMMRAIIFFYFGKSGAK